MLCENSVWSSIGLSDWMRYFDDLRKKILHLKSSYSCKFNQLKHSCFRKSRALERWDYPLIILIELVHKLGSLYQTCNWRNLIQNGSQLTPLLALVRKVIFFDSWLGLHISKYFYSIKSFIYKIALQKMKDLFWWLSD